MSGSLGTRGGSRRTENWSLPAVSLAEQHTGHRSIELLLPLAPEWLSGAYVDLLEPPGWSSVRILSFRICAVMEKVGNY